MIRDVLFFSYKALGLVDTKLILNFLVLVCDTYIVLPRFGYMLAI